ncbi:MAG: hypothetical protein AAFV29_03610 [Myxococcota bacterium]
MLLLSIAATGLLANTGCFLISADFEGDVNVLVDFLEQEDNTYSGTQTVDPNDYEEYRDNRDRIKDGELLGIDVEFVDVPPENDATYGVGRIDIKRAGEPDENYIETVGEWSGVNIVRGNSFPVELTPVAKGQVDELLFGSNPGALDLRIVGETDTATIAFTAQITIRLRFTAGI